MKGKWKVYSQYFDGKANYIAGRQLDLDKPLHGGNIVGKIKHNKPLDKLQGHSYKTLKTKYRLVNKCVKNAYKTLTSV